VVKRKQREVKKAPAAEKAPAAKKEEGEHGGAKETEGLPKEIAAV